MRCKLNDHIEIFNGKDGSWLSTITYITKKKCTLLPETKIQEQEQFTKLSILFAPTKNTSSSYIIQKMTELGVSDIYPIITTRSVIKKINLERLQHNAIEASEQCLRNTVPKVHNISSLTNTLEHTKFAGNIILCDERRNSKPISQIQLSSSDNAIIIGPEGGFTKDEFTFLSQFKSLIPITLGPRILRADTAAIASITAYQIHNGDWKE